MSAVATLCDLRTLIVPSAHSARPTGTRALSRILQQSPAFCPPCKTSGLGGIVCREQWGARQARFCKRLTCRNYHIETIQQTFALTVGLLAEVLQAGVQGRLRRRRRLRLRAGCSCCKTGRKSSASRRACHSCRISHWTRSPRVSGRLLASS